MTTALCTIFAVIVLVLLLLPTYWMVQTSFQIGRNINTFPPVWFPREVTVSSYVKLFGSLHEEASLPFRDYFRNSFLAALLSCFFSVILGTLSSYAFARFDFPGKRNLFLGVILMRAIPGLALGLPLLVLFRRIQLVNTVSGLIFTYTMLNTPFVIWLMESFFADVPGELSEAALIDGCSRWQALWKVDIPLVTPGISASAIFSFLLSWNEFAIALILTRTPASRTLPVGLFDFVGEFFIDWGGMCAAGTIILIPAVALTFFIQRWMVRGLTFGAIK